MVCNWVLEATDLTQGPTKHGCKVSTNKIFNWQAFPSQVTYISWVWIKLPSHTWIFVECWVNFWVFSSQVTYISWVWIELPSHTWIFVECWVNFWVFPKSELDLKFDWVFPKSELDLEFDSLTMPNLFSSNLDLSWVKLVSLRSLSQV